MGDDNESSACDLDALRELKEQNEILQRELDDAKSTLAVAECVKVSMKGRTLLWGAWMTFLSFLFFRRAWWSWSGKKVRWTRNWPPCNSC